jgi:hypothetical protein
VTVLSDYEAKRRIENVEWIIDSDHPDSIAERIGRIEGRQLTALGLAKWLERHDRLDLARRFWRKIEQRADVAA